MDPLRHSPLSFPQLLQGYRLYHQARGSSPTTQDTINRALMQLAEHLPIECREDVRTITAAHITDWAASLLLARYSAATRDQRITKVKAFFNWAVKEGFLDASPAAGLRRPRNTWQPDPFSQEDLRRVLQQAHHAARDYAIVCLLIDTGIRASELCAIPVDALDLNSGQIRILGKGGTMRTVVVGKRTKTALWRWLMVRPSDCDVPNLFVSRRGRALSRTVLGRHVRNIGKRAGVVPCYPHRFRHTFAVMYLRAGGDPYSLQYLLGHSDMTVTRMYVKLAAVDIGDLYRSPLDKLLA